MSVKIEVVAQFEPCSSYRFGIETDFISETSSNLLARWIYGDGTLETGNSKTELKIDRFCVTSGDP